MYTHIAQDGNIVKLPTQAKNAIDYTIKKNEMTKKRIKLKNKDTIWSLTDQSLYEIKWWAIAMGKLPRKN